MAKLQRICIFIFFAFSYMLEASDAVWTGAISSDLNTAGNWNPETVPTGTATFDSSPEPDSFNPTATALFQIDNFFFSGEASDYSFAITGPGALNFNGAGITGNTTNTTITATNTAAVYTNDPQIYFIANASASIGNAVLSANNLSGGILNSEGSNSQIYFGSFFSTTVPFSAGDNAVISAINNDSQVTGDDESAQIFFQDCAFNAGDNFVLSATNTGAGLVAGYLDCGQLILEVFQTPEATFTTGAFADITLKNEEGSYLYTDSSNSAQLLINSQGETASFSLGNGSNLTLINDNNAVISGIIGNGDSGQIVLEGNGTVTTFSMGDSGSLTATNSNASTIYYASNAGQILINGSINTAFSMGKNSTIVLTNDSTSSISANNSAGQIVVTSVCGDAVFAVGDQSSLTSINSGSINSYSSVPVGQLVFIGSSLNAGNSAITAINRNGAIISNSFSVDLAAQIYFADALVVGSPTITAINQYPTLGTINGIIFAGSSTAPNANIVLQNTSLTIFTESNPFIIASLTGDSTSVVNLYRDFQINTVAGSTTTFAGVISDVSGTNNLFIGGAGTQILSAANTFGGNTTVLDGTLILNGSVLNNLTVNGGFLGGTGTIGGNLIVNSGGTVRPGNSIGTLTVNGNYTQNSGIYAVQLDDLGNSSLIQVSGTALLNGGEVVVDPIGGLLPSAKYLILNAIGGVTGNYSGVELLDPSVNLTPILVYEPNDVYLEFLLAFPASTCTQMGVASILNTVILFPNVEVDPIIQNLYALNSAQDVQNALDQISGEQYTTIVDTIEINTQQFLRRLYNPLRTLVTTLPCCNTCCCKPSWDGWLEASGGQTHLFGNQNSHGLRMNSYEVTGGLQCNLNSKTTVGTGVSYVHDDINYRIGGHGNNQTIFAGLYGLYRPDRYYVLADVAYGYSQDKITRPVRFPFTTFRSTGKTEINQGIGYVEVGYDYCLGFNPGLLLQPFVGVEINSYNRGRVHEHSDNLLGLDIHAKSRTNCFSRLGIHLTTTDNPYANLSLDLAWQYRFTSDNPNLSVYFQSFQDGFKICGHSIGRNSLDYAVTYTTEICSQWQLYVEAAGQLWQHANTYDIMGGIKYSW